MKQNNHNEDFQRGKKKKKSGLSCKRESVRHEEQGGMANTCQAAHFIYLSLACLPRRRINTPGEGWDFSYVN